jgi:hypothetical protein
LSALLNRAAVKKMLIVSYAPSIVRYKRVFTIQKKTFPALKEVRGQNIYIRGKTTMAGAR